MTNNNEREVPARMMIESRQGEALQMEINSSSEGKRMYIESYGCQMNFSDSEIVASVLADKGYRLTNHYNEADVILINTCSIRDNAETRVRNRLKAFNSLKQKRPGVLVGVLGCMAERLKSKLLEEEKIVDLVVGPDAYRDLPLLIDEAESGQKAVNVFLSREETYSDISPVRLQSNGVSAFISIMRGCNNMCSFCVVPYTRGRERSRSAISIVEEAKELFGRGFKEVTLLGQNVDSYHWLDETTGQDVNFARLLQLVAGVSSEMRIRFSTSHPKDITDEVLQTMAAHQNICNYIHLPVQSGSSRILEKMNRNYSREWYLERIRRIREIIPGCAISTDVITGFCSETEAEHRETLSLMEHVKYDMAYMFHYSERPGTPAAKNLVDDIPPDTKKRRLQEVISLQQSHALESNKKMINNIYEILVEGPSKRSEAQLCGRTDSNKMVVFSANAAKPGDYVRIRITDCTSATLFGDLI